MTVQRYMNPRARAITTGYGRAEIRFAVEGQEVLLDLHAASNSVQQRTSTAWKKCIAVDCLGSAVSDDGRCYLHASHGAALLKTHCQTSRDAGIDLRGVELTKDLWRTVCTYIPRSIDCSGATFPFGIRVEDLQFHALILTGATVGAGLHMEGCGFDQLNLEFVDFGNISSGFENCTVQSRIDASYAHADQHIYFLGCEFNGDVVCDGVTPDIRFDSSAMRSLSLRGARLVHASLENVKISEELDIDMLKAERLSAAGLIVGATHIGPVDVVHDCDLTSARFTKRVQIEVDAGQLILEGCSFEAGGRLDVGRAEVKLDRLTVNGRFTVVGRDDASVMSMRNADAGAITMSSVDLRGCIFWGAPNLDEISLEPTVVMAHPPGWWRTRRRYVADEAVWRLQNSRGSWRPVILIPNPARYETSIISASQVAGVYRALRKSYEEKSNQPGAADFYYGEMEMRRLDGATHLPERIVLAAYWATSGYGLRAIRAIAILLVVFAAGSVAMTLSGIAEQGSPTLIDGLLVSMETSIPGAHTDTPLTNWGRGISLLLKVFVPILVTFAVLAVRNRVRR